MTKERKRTGRRTRRTEEKRNGKKERWERDGTLDDATV